MTIKELVQTTKEVVGFHVQLIFDKLKPDGTMRRLMDVSMLCELGYVERTNLRGGLELLMKIFKKIA